MKRFSIFGSALMVLAVCAAGSLFAEDRTISTDTEINEAVSYDTLKITTSTDNGVVNVTLGSNANVTVTTNLRMGDSSNTQTENLTINGGMLNLTATTGPDSSYPLKFNMVGHYPASTSTININEGGSLTAYRLVVGWHGKGYLNINNGTASINNLDFGGNYQLGNHKAVSGVTIGANGTLKVQTTVRNEGSAGPLDQTITLSGGTLTTLDDQTTATVNIPLVLTEGTTSKLDVPSGKTFTLSPATISGAGTLNVTGEGTFNLTGTTTLSGTMTRSGNVFMTSSAALTVADGGSFTTNNLLLRGATLTVQDGAAVSLGRIVICDANNATSSVTQSGGTVNITGTNNTHTTSASFMVGHWPGGATYTLSGGTLNSLGADMHLTWDCNGTFTATGGTANLLGIIMEDHNANRVGTVNLDGARVNIGASGITRTNLSSTVAHTVNLKSGTLGALADWSSPLKMNLTGGSVKIDTAKWDAAAGASTTTGQTITLSGALSGTGGITKVGEGTLILSGQNTYTGSTVIQGGTVDVSGKLAGNISIQKGTLNIKDGANITVSWFNICDASGNPTCTVNQTGGSITVLGTNFPAKVTNGGSFKISHYPGTANYNLYAGTLTAKNALTQISWDGSATLNVAGGTADLYGIALCDHNYSETSLSGTTAVFRMNFDSTKATAAPVVKIGEGGINYWRDISNGSQNFCPDKSANDSKKYAELGNGTIQATADWSSNLPLKLTDAANGTTFDTQDYKITLKNGLQGAGSLKVQGNGEVEVQGDVTYAGSTTIDEGATLTFKTDSAYIINALGGTGTLAAAGTSELTLPADTAFEGTLLLKESGKVKAAGEVKNLEFANGGILQLTASEDESELFSITGDVTAAGGAIEILNSADEDVIQIAKLLNPDEFANLASVSAYRGGESLVLALDGNILMAGTHDALPEPSTWLLLVLGLVGLTELKRFGRTASRRS
ncbi:MAG: autotransporter-associated beta strand repeat-containing protein [Thermoguttaceae bacterium]|nr:autotransporter-associated beta strand repeat-containing protein [Thermoguttaceae bacterium]